MKQYIVDAFTDKNFSGNPAGVCILEKWISDDLMKNIARENNLSETAFAVKTSGNSYRLRWFTPAGEIDFCGHATLATAYVIRRFYDTENNIINFNTMSGNFNVIVNNDVYEMNFPMYSLNEIPITENMTKAIGVTKQSIKILTIVFICVIIYPYNEVQSGYCAFVYLYHIKRKPSVDTENYERRTD